MSWLTSESVIAAAIGAAGALGLRWFPKTHSETLKDEASVRRLDAEAWQALVADLRAEIVRLRAEATDMRAEIVRLEQSIRDLRHD